MKLIKKIFFSVVILSCSILAQSPVTITIDTKSPGAFIPAEFSGLSFETQSLLPNNAGVKGYFFDSTNTQLLTLFKNMGIKNIRIGGGTVDIKEIPIPNHEDIDALFRFAKTAGVKVIYSLRLQNGDPLQDASIVKYIWDNYKQYVSYFAVGNEPDYGIGKKRDCDITDYLTFLSKWRKFPSAIQDSVLGAKLGGADAANWKWNIDFAHDEFGKGNVESIYFHYYAGGNTRHKTPQQFVDAMLSAEWDTVNYPKHFKMAMSTGFPYRFTEANCYVTPNPEDWGFHNGYSVFATALFSLDFIHWWSTAQNCQGADFHTRQWKYNGTVYSDTNGNFQIYPVGYGIAAFNLGGQGRIFPVTISNPDSVTLTAYAVGSPDSLTVTIINKEYGSTAREAKIKIAAPELPHKAAAMYLTAPGNDPFAMTGIKLGGELINNFESFKGKWTQIDTEENRSCQVKVPPTSAVIVKFVNHE